MYFGILQNTMQYGIIIAGVLMLLICDNPQKTPRGHTVNQVGGSGPEFMGGGRF
jgi:hypothetical protein